LHYFLFSIVWKDYNNANFCEASSWQVEKEAHTTQVNVAIAELSEAQTEPKEP